MSATAKVEKTLLGKDLSRGKSFTARIAIIFAPKARDTIAVQKTLVGEMKKMMSETKMFTMWNVMNFQELIACMVIVRPIGVSVILPTEF